MNTMGDIIFGFVLGFIVCGIISILILGYQRNAWKQELVDCGYATYTVNNEGQVAWKYIHED